jgi:hypothetical protein
MRSDTTQAGQRDLAAILRDVRVRIAGLLVDRPELEDDTVRDVLRGLREDRSSMPDDVMSRLITDAVISEHDLRTAVDAREPAMT